MSKEQKREDDLPTAAIVSFAGEETHEFEAYGSDETDLTYKDDVEQGDELVRRKDVAKLIQDKKEQLEESIERLPEGSNQYNSCVDSHILLEELLDEVENQ